MISVEQLLADLDPQWSECDQLAANLDAAERAYRADPKLARDFEETGWFPERTEAARRGEAIWSEGRRASEPIIQLTPTPGSVQFRTSPWAGFAGLLGEIGRRRVELLERRRPEILAAIADREAELRGRVLDTKVRDLGPLVAEADELLAAAVRVRGPLPRTVRTPTGLAPQKYREQTDELELTDAALGGWSLLDPVEGEEPVSVITSSLGIQRDTSPSPSVEETRRRHQQVALRFGTHRG